MKFFFALTLSALFFTTASAHEAHHHHHDMKADKTLSGESIYQLEDQWTDQNAKTIKLKQLAGKPRLAVMLYTRCKTTCPLLIADIQDIQSKLSAKEKKELMISVFSFDSENETPKSLKEFSTKRKLDKNWQLLKADKDAVASLAAALGVRYKRLDDGEYIHSNVIYLLDRDGVVLTQKEGFKKNDKTFLEAIKKAL